jgi:hypothetical protein
MPQAVSRSKFIEPSLLEALGDHVRKPFRPQNAKKLSKAVLTAEIASSLLPKKKPRHDLVADPFTDIEEDAAVVLATHQGTLYLNGLTHLSDTSAEALSKHGNSLYLNGLTDLSETSARHLARHHDKLFLNGLKHISDEVAQALIAQKGDLLLNGIQKLSDESATLLSKHAGWLHLNGLTEFPDTPGHIALAHRFAAWHGFGLAFNDLKEMPLPILRILATHRGGLELKSFELLSPEAASIFADAGYYLGFAGFKTISIEAARVLVERKGIRCLYNMECVSEDVMSKIHEEYPHGKRHDQAWESNMGSLFGSDPSTPSSLFSMPVNYAKSCFGDYGEDMEECESSDQSKPPNKRTIQDLLKVKRPDQLPHLNNNEEESDDESWIEEENETLNRVAGITDQEREMYRIFMGWGSEGALSFAQVGKRYSMSASAARSICERVEQRLITSKSFPPKPFYSAPPATEDLRPRDGAPLRKTKDVLFLALMLEECAKTGWMETTIDDSGQQTYRIIAKPATSAAKGQQFWKMKTLKKALFDHEFWEVRRLRRHPDGHRIKIPRGHILKFPVKRGADPLLSSDTWSEQFHSWANVEDLVVKPGEILCPLCGPMPPLIVPVTSPSETWAMLCGRSYHFYCCSGCLGAFDQDLTRMN